jgi:ABC-type transport system involved in cytochrome bd biosynthesis fused ATPase/permease subunit
MATIERISLQRNVAVVRDDAIAVRPSRGQLLGPAIELGIAAACGLLIAAFIDALPLLLLMLLLLVSIILGPVGVLGLVYSAIGSSFMMERRKQTARWQQGFLGLGIGTVELVPFGRIKRIEVSGDYDSELNSGEMQDIVHFAVVLVKDNDRRLTIGTVAAARPLAHLGAERANRLAAHVAAMAEVESAPAEIPGLDTMEATSEAAPRSRRRRRVRRVSPPQGGV